MVDANDEARPPRAEHLVVRASRGFERVVVVSLISMMAVVVALATLELGWILVHDIVSPPILILEVDELLDIFGVFLLVVIGLELMGTIRAYLEKGVIHVEVVLEVALVAIARKVIVLDLSKYSGTAVLGVAALIAALAIAAYSRTRRAGRSSSAAR